MKSGLEIHCPALKNGIPSISTIRRILNVIDPKQFEKYLISWTKQLTVFSEDGGDIVAIDGKTMKGSRDGDKITHIVSVLPKAYLFKIFHIQGNNVTYQPWRNDPFSNEL